MSTSHLLLLPLQNVATRISHANLDNLGITQIAGLLFTRCMKLGVFLVVIINCTNVLLVHIVICAARGSKVIYSTWRIYVFLIPSSFIHCLKVKSAPATIPNDILRPHYWALLESSGDHITQENTLQPLPDKPVLC